MNCLEFLEAMEYLFRKELPKILLPVIEKISSNRATTRAN